MYRGPLVSGFVDILVYFNKLASTFLKKIKILEIKLFFYMTF